MTDLPYTSSSSLPYATDTFGQQQYDMVSPDERSAAMLSWLGSLIFGIFAPLIAYFVKKDSPFVRRHAAQGINLYLTAILVSFSIMVLFLLLSIAMTTVDSLFFGPLVLFIIVAFVAMGVSTACFVAGIIGAIRSNAGDEFTVPYILRLVSE